MIDLLDGQIRESSMATRLHPRRLHGGEVIFSHMDGGVLGRTAKVAPG